MGLVRRQGSLFTLISYFGTFIGAINVLYLVPSMIGMSNYGLLNLLIALSIIYSQISQIGIPSILIKYFAEFRSEDKRHAGFITWLFMLGLVAFCLFTGIFIGLKHYIVNLYAEQSPDFSRYFYHVIVLACFTILYAVLDTLARALYKSILSAFLNDIMMRLTTSFCIVLFYLKLIDIDGFINLYILANGVFCLILFIQLGRSGEFVLSFNINIDQSRRKELLQYGLYNLLAGSTLIIIQKLDTLSLAHFTGQAIVGVYSTYLYISAVIYIPSKALNRINYTLVSEAYVKKEMDVIGKIYRRTSIIQMLLGCFIFCGIVLNKENLLQIVTKPIFRSQFSCFYWLGIATLVDITGGLNTYIIAISHKFRISTLILVSTLFLCLGLNYYLIPRYGSVGAAMAIFFSNTFLNLVNWYYLKMRFSLQPFTWKHVGLILITLFVLFIFSLLPRLGTTYFDVLLRSVLITVVFGFLVIVFNISSDITELVKKGKSLFYARFKTSSF